MLDQIEVAGFFFISGYLYNDRGNNIEWLTGKFKRLIVPFLFFGLLYAVADISCHPMRFAHEWKSYLFHMYLSPINYPMWFIQALFWTMLIQRMIRNLHFRMQCGLIVCIAGCLSLMGNDIIPEPNNKLKLLFLTSNIPCAIASFPFFWCGHILARNKVLALVSPNKFRWSLFTVCLILWYLFAKPNVHLHVPSAESWAFLYISALSGSMAILLFSKNFPPIPIINYFGKHSLIILGTHAIVIHVIRHFGIQSPAVVTLCTVITMPPVIYVLQHYLPRLSGEHIHPKRR